MSDDASFFAALPVRECDVVVIGAGLAGLTAGRELLKAGLEVLVLEARERVGGRTYSRPASDGTLLDLGGQWIGPTQERLAALVEEFGIRTFPTYNEGKNIEFYAGERAEYEGALPMGDPLAMMEIIEAMLDLNLLADEVPLETPWTAPHASEWDGQTVETWLLTHLESEHARHLLTLAVQSVFSVEPRDLSLLHFLFYIRSGGNLNQLISIANGAQERRFHAGAQTISNHLAAHLGERVVLNAPVHTLHHAGPAVQAVSDTLVVQAGRAIIAMPPTLAGRLRYRPALPAYRDQLTQRVPMGTVIKVQCVYERPFWRAAGYSGQVTSDRGAVRITFDNSPEQGPAGVLMGFMEGDKGRVWGRRTREERRAEVIACFVSYFGEQAAQPVAYEELNWSEEEYSRGCYAGVMAPGAWLGYGEALRQPLGKLHWAGTETATVWNGYMDGAVQSGERAAREVLELIVDTTH
ncbi:MAG TPA: flavin monoamine oxidase family protein [Ktedonobacteraceae bacterium]